MTFCGNCGSDNPAGNRFCFSCGAELSARPQEPQLGYNPNAGQEIERLGPYNPNANYYVPPAQQYGQQQPFQQPYQQPYQQQPGQQQYMQQPYQQQQYPPAPYQQFNPYGGRPQPFYLQGAPNNNTNLRWIAIILAIATLAVTLVSLFVIPIDDSGTTLLGLGLDDPDAMVVLVFVIISLVIGIVGVFIPIFSIVTGVCVIATVALLFTNEGYSFDTSVLFIFVGVSVVIMVLGLIASLFMNKYVRSNVRNVTMFDCCMMTWKGVRLPVQQQPLQQYRY